MTGPCGATGDGEMRGMTGENKVYGTFLRSRCSRVFRGVMGMEFEDARKKFGDGTKRAVAVVRVTATTGMFVWKSFGSPMPVPPQPQLDQGRNDPRITRQVPAPGPSVQEQSEQLADHHQNIQEQRRKHAKELGFSLREPEQREQRPRPRSR